MLRLLYVMIPTVGIGLVILALGTQDKTLAGPPEGAPMLMAQMSDMPGHSMDEPAGSGAPVSGNQAFVGEFRAAMDRMHTEMAVELTGDPDRDFAAAMIPHHQGAIDMARIALEHAEDPDLRNLAEQVISAQEEEIAFLRSWLEKNTP